MTGPDELREWIKSRHYTVVAAAEVIGIPVASLRAYLSRARVPNAARVERLRVKCGIRGKAWVKP